MSYSGLYRNVRKMSEIIVLVLICSLSCNAQDLIIRNGGADTIKCVIIEDKITFLSYRLFNSNDTNLYIIKTSDYEQYYRKKTTEYFDKDSVNSYNIITNSDNNIINKTIKVTKLKGGYLTFTEFKNNTPSVVFDFEVIRRSGFDIAMMGGNDYKIISKDENVTKNMINKKFWAICNDSCSYINCHKIKGYRFYSLLTFKEGYACFSALPPPKDLRSSTEAGMMFGAVGGAASGAAAALQRIIYRLDLETGEVTKYLNQ